MRSNVDGYFGRELPADMVRIFGSGGNFAFILPSHDLIVVRCARTDNQVAELLEAKFLKRLVKVLQPVATTAPR